MVTNNLTINPKKCMLISKHHNTTPKFNHISDNTTAEVKSIIFLAISIDSYFENKQATYTQPHVSYAILTCATSHDNQL